MNFAFPWAALFILPLAFAAWRLFRRARKTGVRFSMASYLRTELSWRVRLLSVTPYLIVAALALLVIALSRPRTQLSRSSRTVDAISIAMVVDISESMNALDLAPKEVLQGKADFTLDMTRLSVVKKLFADFVEKRSDDLISLTTFGGYASTRVPLTADHKALLGVLKGVQIPSSSLDESGNMIAPDELMTAVGDGLARGIMSVKDSKPKSKIIILLSDGLSNTGAVEPKEATKIAADLGIKVYTIGVGTHSQNTPVVVRDFFGRQRVTYARMSFDENELKRIASETKGMYFRVDDRAALEKALAEINELETTKLEADVYDRYDEHFQVFLMSGVLLLLVAFSLSMFANRRLA
jgi:Ca-activated chloride channel family protein